MSDTTSGDGSTGRSPGIFDADPPPEIDPNRFGPIPIVSVEDEAKSDGDDISIENDDTELPHWTAPATGQVPRVVATSGDQDWSEVAGPRWHGEGPEWADDDLGSVLGETPAPVMAAAKPTEPTPAKKVTIDDEELETGMAEPSFGDPQRRQPTADRPVRRTRASEPAASVERNIPQAIGVGLAVAALALVAFRISGNIPALLLITVVTVLAAVEAFNTMRIAGSHPATLLGIVACASLPVAAYNVGDSAFPMVLALSVVFGALWYLSGADTQRPALNLGLTFLGIGWIGVMAGFAGLILRMDDGKSIVVAAIVVTALYDTGALAGGTFLANPGRPFHPASPSKTWEGTIAGAVLAILAGAVIGIYDISPFSTSFSHAIYLGVIGAVMAPLGDLAQSMIKRDLGVKDMGTILPGHGGVLDRIDGLLFVLPGTYYLALILGYT